MVIFQKPFVSYITSDEYEMLKIDIQNTIYANNIAILTCMYIATCTAELSKISSHCSYTI